MLFPPGAAFAKTNNMKEWLKKLDWKAILIGLLTLIVGADKAPAAYDFVTGSAPKTPEQVAPEVPDNLYTVTASFYVQKWIKVGNFSDVSTEDEIGMYTVRVEKPSRDRIEEEFRAAYPAYPGGKLGKITQVVKPKGGEEEPGQEDPDTE